MSTWRYCSDDDGNRVPLQVAVGSENAVETDLGKMSIVDGVELPLWN